jgi:hypothetical protein
LGNGVGEPRAEDHEDPSRAAAGPAKAFRRNRRHEQSDQQQSERGRVVEVYKVQ